MGIITRYLRTFPPSQRDDLGRVIAQVRRRLDANFDAVSAAHNATTTLASLTANANEVDVGTVLHLQVAGSITCTGGSPVNYTPLFAINGTTAFTDVIAVPDAGTDVVKAYTLDVRVVYTTPAVLKLWGEFKVSGDNAAAADTGTGTLASAQVISTPFYHTLSSQHIARDQLFTVTLAIANTATASATKQAAVLWAE